jgi:hypothetical protein
MTTLHASPPVVLDESAHAFISTFMAHVASFAGCGEDRRSTVAGIELLLLAAMAQGGGSAPREWRALYRAIDELIDESFCARETRSAYAYLHVFLEENVDLA